MRLPSPRTIKSRTVVLVGSATIFLVGLSSGAAFAYFTNSGGSGSGSATTSGTAPSSVTVEAAAGSPTSLLQPGSSADLTLTINNPNTFALTLTAVSQSGAVSVVGGGGACTSDTGTWPSLALGTSGVSVPSLSGLSVNIPAGPGNVTVHIPSGASMTSASNSACQGASFHVPVTITVHKG